MFHSGIVVAFPFSAAIEVVVSRATVAGVLIAPDSGENADVAAMQHETIERVQDNGLGFAEALKGDWSRLGIGECLQIYASTIKAASERG